METLAPIKKAEPSAPNGENSVAAGALPKPIYLQHPLSAVFPVMTGDDYQALIDSITNIGVQNPITLSDGMVIDGWHRYRAATELGMDCPAVDIDPDIDPRDFVLAQNKARRHILAAQLAMATTAVYAWHPAGRPQNSTPGVEFSKSTAEMATVAGVHPNTITQAKAVQTQAVPEVVEAVMRGAVGLRKASAIAKLPIDQQAAALNQPMPKAPPIDAHLNTMPACDDGPSAEELAVSHAAEQADRLAMQKLLDADDKLAAAFSEITRLNLINASLQERLNGLMNEKNEAVKQCKVLQRQLDHPRKGVS